MTATSRKTVRVVRADITTYDTDAFVYYAQPNLVLGTGFGNAIAVRGGPSIQQELNRLAPVETGGAVITSAGRLKATYIIHAVGPRFQEPDLEKKLRRTIITALAKADEKGIVRLAFPAMGRGFYGVPLAASARITAETIKTYLAGKTGIQEVVICVNDPAEVAAFQGFLPPETT
ncbi:MAG: macro domain-containing protein [Planctomycetota bacterium]